MKVLHITNIPSPYRVRYFNELGKYCDLTVIFECNSSLERDSSWKRFSFDSFRGIICGGIRTRVDSSFTLKPLKYLKKGAYDWIIISNIMSLTGLFEIIHLKMHKIPYWVEGDGAFVNLEEKKWKYLLKRFLLSGAQGYLTTCKNHDDYCRRYGAREGQIVRYPFSSVEQKDVLPQPVPMQERQKIRKQLNMLEENIVITVGQFIHRKGLDLLIEVAKQVDTTIGFYFIGGDKLAEVDERQNIHIIPFQQKEKLYQYYDAADLFVCPTREDIWGLVVNEAMARGLPVITTERCNAGLELVKNGECGYLVPVENVPMLKEKILELLYREEKDQMVKKSLDISRKYTIETMARKHLQIYEEYIK